MHFGNDFGIQKDNQTTTGIQTALIALITIGCLIPFSSKAFHMDDTLFLWAAKHIRCHPWDFYGFTANWYDTAMPMSQINQNPPLIAYVIAAVSFLVGWNETGIHIVWLIFPIGLSVGTYYIATFFCSQPAGAALIALLNPAFLVSATNVMTDTPMLAFYVWAMVLWIQGETSGCLRCFVGSAVLIALSSLTKYFGMTAIPLLLVYSILSKKKFEKKLLTLLIPIAVMIGYEWLTYQLYGHGLLSNAAVYAAEERQLNRLSLSQMFPELLIGLAFTGGCLASAAFYAPVLWNSLSRLIGWAAIVLWMLMLAIMRHIGEYPLVDAGRIRWEIIIQLSVMIVAGIHIIALALDELWHDRSPASVLLFLWILGVFVFAVFVNWTISARNFLPMTPAVGIIVMRQIDRKFPSKPVPAKYIALPLIPALSLALVVTYADYSYAVTQKIAAYQIQDTLKNDPHTVWFQGHWGFQYYMESLGYQSFDIHQSMIQAGDILVIPENNANLFLPDNNRFHLIKKLEMPPFKWIGTMEHVSGAGFYSTLWGPLPFAIGPIRPEIYFIFQVTY